MPTARPETWVRREVRVFPRQGLITTAKPASTRGSRGVVKIGSAAPLRRPAAIAHVRA